MVKQFGFIFLFCFSFCSSIYSVEFPQYFWVTVDSKHLGVIKEKIDIKKWTTNSTSGVSLLKISFSDLENLSDLLGQQKKRTHFMGHWSEAEGVLALKNSEKEKKGSLKLFNYTLTEENLAQRVIEDVEEKNLVHSIQELSSFNYRHYLTANGREVAYMIHGWWRKLTSHRNDVRITYFNHGWKQPSVILRIKGSLYPEQEVVVGAHMDTKVGKGLWPWYYAPGVDDNASGVADLTEMLRILMEYDYRPQRTITFIAYSAEELGLLGSKDIARYYDEEGRYAVGVLNLDMTNFKGSEKDIYLMTDYTNEAQNNFIGKLIDNYLEVPWGFDVCGYACSDHASWTRYGYPSSYPFEAYGDEYNHNIHTAEDTLEVSGGHAYHSVTFTRLGLIYIVEMGKGTSSHF